MADFTLLGLPLKTVEDVRDDILRVARLGCWTRLRDKNGNPLDLAVGPNTEIYQRATAIATQIVVAAANTAVQADQDMPDTAFGSGLDRWGEVLQLLRNEAIGSVGYIVTTSTTDILIAQGTQLVDESGLYYQVTVGGSFPSGSSVQVNAISTGDGTNLAEGTTLRWINIPAYSADTAEVGTGGLVGGANAESDEPFRARILARIANPPSTGNWSHLAAIIEEATSLVRKAFVYPAAEGPSTAHWAAA